jgi:ParB family chromosome partitioning protein
MGQQMIALSQLTPSPGNVRKTGGIPIYKLANSILAHGLLQNLVVTPAGDGFQVDAGGRRLQALRELAKAGKIPNDFQVPCLVVEAGTSAHEASLAENVARESMHPVDEFLAFKQLADEGQSAAAIADRFGSTEKHILQRLKLANVSPKILDEYRAGKATLEQLQVLALVEDHARQEKAWAAGARDEWKRRPGNLRDLITDREVGTNDGLGKFVGAEAYEKAGGVVRRDFFGTAGEAWLIDRKLAETLALAKLEVKAAELRKKGWGWVEARVSCDYSDLCKFTQTYNRTPAGHAGCIVSINDHRGEIEVHHGLVKPGTKVPSSGKTTAGKAAKAKPAKKPGDLPFSQVQRLQGERTAIMRVELAKTPRIAMAALAATLAQSLTKRDMYGERGGADSIVRIQPVSERFGDGRMPPMAREGLEPATATKVLAEQRKAWLDRLKAAKGDIFAWLLTQPEKTTHELLAFVAGSAINATTFMAEKSDDGAKFAHLAGVDLAKLWTVTPAWCAKQTRGYLVAAVTEACGAVAAAPLAKAKTPEAAKLAAPLLAKAGWVPPPMRSPNTPKPKPAAKKATKTPAKKAATKKTGAKK